MSDSPTTIPGRRQRPLLIPDGWVVVSPYPSSDEDSRPESIRLVQSQVQQHGQTLPAAEQLAELDWDRALSAVVLDDLLANPQVIPLKWKGKAIAFWGTRYRDDQGEIAVRYLFWNGIAWDWYFHHLNDLLDAHCSAATRA
jgi:hypothetical protein